jgi:FkbM family methyltransferase
VSLAAAQLVGHSGVVVAIEPSSVNRDFLVRHLAWNRIDNARVIADALSDREGVDRFGGSGSSVAFKLGTGSERIPVRTFAALAKELGLERHPAVLKIDVEGEEAAVLRGAGELLGGDQALLVSTHGRALYEECRAILERRGFEIFDSWEIRERRDHPDRPWSSDHDLLAIGPMRTFDEAQIKSLRLIAGPEKVNGPPG